MMPIEAIFENEELESFLDWMAMTQQCRQNLEILETNAIAYLERHHLTRGVC